LLTKGQEGFEIPSEEGGEPAATEEETF